MSKLISIIIPMYNSEATIQRCINSILAQTYENFEVILIDDGSVDNTYQLCHEKYEVNDSRIVLKKMDKNSGVSAARNLGLKFAKGELIQFVDSDDFIRPNMLEIMVAAMQGYDIIISGYFNKFDNQSIKINYSCDKRLNIEEFKDQFYLLYKNLLLNVVWNKLYVRKILMDNQITFQEDVFIGEDLIFNLQYYSYCKRIRMIEEPLYYYTNYPHVTKKYYDTLLEKLDNQKRLFDCVKNFTQRDYEKYNQYFEYIVFDEVYDLIYSHKEIKEKERILDQIREKYGIVVNILG